MSFFNNVGVNIKYLPFKNVEDYRDEAVHSKVYEDLRSSQSGCILLFYPEFWNDVVRIVGEWDKHKQHSMDEIYNMRIASRFISNFTDNIIGNIPKSQPKAFAVEVCDNSDNYMYCREDCVFRKFPCICSCLGCHGRVFYKFVR